MNEKKLLAAQKKFLAEYPGGMAHPAMIEIAKKHGMEKLVNFARENFSELAFADLEQVADAMVKLVTRSSMVSVFEKPKFKDTVKGMTVSERRELVEGLREFLHGNEESGFNRILVVLDRYKLAKWTIMTVFRCYHNPETDLLYKPTTVKRVIEFFELEGLVYRALPSYDFFIAYRKAFNEMKGRCDPSLSPSNAAFSGFLWMVTN